MSDFLSICPFPAQFSEMHFSGAVFKMCPKDNESEYMMFLELLFVSTLNKVVVFDYSSVSLVSFSFFSPLPEKKVSQF